MSYKPFGGYESIIELVGGIVRVTSVGMKQADSEAAGRRVMCSDYVLNKVCSHSGESSVVFE